MKKGDILTVIIDDLAFGGKSLVRFEDGFIVFVDGGIPRQEVRVRIVKKKKNFAEAKLLEVIKQSQLEVETPYQPIGGARWARLPVELQQKYKQQQVVDLFRKFAEMDIVVESFISSPLLWNYRNKVEYSFGPTAESQGDAGEWTHSGFGLGFKRSGQFWMVESLEKPSGLFDESFEAFLSEIESWCEATDLPVYNARTQQGFWRNLVIRKSFDTDQLLICMGTSPWTEDRNQKSEARESFKNLLLDKFGDRIAGIAWQESASLGDSVRNFEVRDLLYGDDKIVERINDLEFEISLDSFFQTNPKSAEKLYALVVQLAQDCIGEEPLILDLFCGTGTIGQIMKKNIPSASVIGVEIVPEAIEDAKQNAQRNNLEGLEFYCGDVKHFLRDNPDIQNIDLIVLDPPRVGIAPKTLKKVIELGSQHIIYVSCNPATMARDALTLKEAGYELGIFSLVDQFPHTSHVECVGVFKK